MIQDNLTSRPLTESYQAPLPCKIPGVPLWTPWGSMTPPTTDASAGSLSFVSLLGLTSVYRGHWRWMLGAVSLGTCSGRPSRGLLCRLHPCRGCTSQPGPAELSLPLASHGCGFLLSGPWPSSALPPPSLVTLVKVSLVACAGLARGMASAAPGLQMGLSR